MPGLVTADEMMADIGTAATSAGEDTTDDAADTVGDFIMDLFWALKRRLRQRRALK